MNRPKSTPSVVAFSAASALESLAVDHAALASTLSALSPAPASAANGDAAIDANTVDNAARRAADVSDSDHVASGKGALVTLAADLAASVSSSAAVAATHAHGPHARVTYVVYENERRFVNAFSPANLLPGERKQWSTADGRARSFADFQLPGRDWRWLSEWHPVVSTPATDPDGWLYATSWSSNSWAATSSAFRPIRRRLWQRVTEQIGSTQSLASLDSSAAGASFRCICDGV
jgi:hypothetical protein